MTNMNIGYLFTQRMEQQKWLTYGSLIHMIMDVLTCKVMVMVV